MDKNTRKGGKKIISKLKYDIETSGYKASAIVLHNYMSNITKKKHVAASISIWVCSIYTDKDAHSLKQGHSSYSAPAICLIMHG